MRDSSIGQLWLEHSPTALPNFHEDGTAVSGASPPLLPSFSFSLRVKYVSHSAKLPSLPFLSVVSPSKILAYLILYLCLLLQGMEILKYSRTSKN